MRAFRDISPRLAASGAILLAGLLFSSGPARGGDLTSANFRLRGGNLNGGGAVGMRSGAPSPGIGTLGGSIGHSEALGFSGSQVTLRTAAPGFWPLVAGGFPTLDIDADLIQAFRDNCPFAPNPLQMDGGGVGAGSRPDGIGDACQCGDVDDDGTVDGSDTDAFRDFLVDPLGMSLLPEGQAKCTVIGVASECDVLDVSVIRRTLDGPDLPPGIAQVCEAALPP
ncbi:MAG: thrombospondin type 3 repeat-containing protein [Myxococcota bacterium]